MKSLTTTTKETPKTSVLSLIVGLLPGLLDQLTPIARFLGIDEGIITTAGLVIGAVIYVLNYIHNNTVNDAKR